LRRNFDSIFDSIHTQSHRIIVMSAKKPPSNGFNDIVVCLATECITALRIYIYIYMPTACKPENGELNSFFLVNQSKICSCQFSPAATATRDARRDCITDGIDIVKRVLIGRTVLSSCVTSSARRSVVTVSMETSTLNGSNQ